jgi:hypothetical protein
VSVAGIKLKKKLCLQVGWVYTPLDETTAEMDTPLSCADAVVLG